MQVRSLGIDAEPHGPLPDGVLPAVSIEAERTWLDTQETGGPCTGIECSSARRKPRTRRGFRSLGAGLGFEDAHITFEAEPDTSGTFNSRLLVPGEATSGPPLTSFDGRWLVSDGLILTAISVQ